MSLFRVILAVLFPPLAVFDKGCGSFVLVAILTVLGWIPGVIAALIIVNGEDSKGLSKKEKDEQWNDWVERTRQKTQAWADKQEIKAQEAKERRQKLKQSVKNKVKGIVDSKSND